MYILWSRGGNFDNTLGSWFEPNHFVPLISEKKEVKTCPVKKNEIKDCFGEKAKQQATLSSFIKAKSTTGSSQASKSTLIGSPSGQKRTAAAANLSKEIQPDAKISPAPPIKNIDKSKMLYKWKDEFPWLTIKEEDQAFLCSLCCKAPDVAGSTQFLTGCFPIKKDSMQKHAKSNGHLRAQTAVLAMQKPVHETVNAQSFNKGRKDEEEKERREVAMKMTTAYFIAKEELPFSKFPGLINLQKKNGLQIWSTYANDKSCAEMMSVLGKVFKERTVSEINQSSYISVMADGATDAGGLENETVFCRYLKDGQQVNRLIEHKAVEHAHAEGK